jgi:hypothetical protein
MRGLFYTHGPVLGPAVDGLRPDAAVSMTIVSA